MLNKQSKANLEEVESLELKSRFMQQNINVDINQTLPVLCEECSGKYFDQTLLIRKASGLLTGQSKPSYIPIPVFACKSCGHVNGDFLPKEISSLDDE